jgi:pimeloyl-ACP methyl ester carboxylesterase
MVWTDPGSLSAASLARIHGMRQTRWTAASESWTVAGQALDDVDHFVSVAAGRIGGGHDPSFQVAEAQAYRRDVPDAEVHILDAGHFALDEQPDAIADLTREFLQRRPDSSDPLFRHRVGRGSLHGGG